MKIARVFTSDGLPRVGPIEIGDTIAEIIPSMPADWPDEIKSLFVEVDDSAEYRSTWDGEAWEPVAVSPPIDPVPSDPPAPVLRKKISPIEFKLQFTMQEGIAITSARKYTGSVEAAKELADALNYFFSIIEDPRLSTVDLDLQHTIDGVGFLAVVGLITADRVPEILAGRE